MKLLHFEIDKLTNSIEHLATGECRATHISVAEQADLRTILKKHGWAFNWRKEAKEPRRVVYKLIANDEPLIQGLVSLEAKLDHVYMHLLESAPWNIGANKVFAGVPGNLVAFACKHSFESGHQGNVAFFSKTKLIDHYEKTLGAKHFGGHVMIIDMPAAVYLIEKYFKGYLK